MCISITSYRSYYLKIFSLRVLYYLYMKRSSGDELFSDTYKMTLVQDCLYEVVGKVRGNSVKSEQAGAALDQHR